MPGILIDTDKLIDIEKSVEELPIEDCYISIITVMSLLEVKPIFLRQRAC